MTVLITAYVCLCLGFCLGFCLGMRTAADLFHLANRKTSTGGL